jgi:hypothetical protein
MGVHDVRGDCAIYLSNGWTIRLHLNQAYRGNDWAVSEPLHGNPTASGRRSGSMHSTDVTGTTRDDDFFLVITWSTGDVGEFHGRFNVAGHLSGNTFNRRKPHEHSTWFCEQGLQTNAVMCRSRE